MTRQLFDLKEKTALITGSTSGIGLQIAKGLRDSGARVVLHGRDPEKIAAAEEELGGCAGSVTFEVTDEAAVTAEIARLESEIGVPDILVNNAGLQIRGPLTEFALDDWNRVIGTNLTGAFLVGRTVARGMIERGSGKVINICSLMSEVGRMTIGPYTAAKGGVKQLTRAMAIEWAPHGIQANGIGPGYFLTKLNTALSENPEFDGWLKKRTPAGRWGRTEELVGPAVFLASSASDFMTGQVIYVDGGILASI
jgi:gluconate 5-dehydrogenase